MEYTTIYFVKGVSYSQVEARSKEEAIQKYKERILEYICDDWEVEVIDDDDDYSKEREVQ